VKGIEIEFPPIRRRKWEIFRPRWSKPIGWMWLGVGLFVAPYPRATRYPNRSLPLE